MTSLARLDYTPDTNLQKIVVSVTAAHYLYIGIMLLRAVVSSYQHYNDILSFAWPASLALWRIKDIDWNSVVLARHTASRLFMGWMH